MNTTVTTDLPPVSPDVIDLATRKGVAFCVRPLLAAAEEIFPGCSITARAERDAEMESDEHVVIEAGVSGWSVDDMFAARNRWSQQFCDICPSENSVVFQIRLVQNA
jgi:hypothetical protein